jgi:hypothetical protein
MAASMTNPPQPDSAHEGQPAPCRVESRRTERQPMASPVRVGWINDEKRMQYVSGWGVDLSESGLAVSTDQRLRLSALVHLEIAERDLVAIGRVRNCIRSGGVWRTGIELVPAR